MSDEQSRSSGPAGASDAPAWVPQSCTLPSVERPLRVADFDALFASALRTLHRPTPTRLHLLFDPAAGPTARGLAARESTCCSFFTFTFTPTREALQMDVEVPATHVTVLDALAARAASHTTAVE